MKKLSILLGALILTLGMSLQTFAAPSKLVDNADLLTPDEEKLVLDELNTVSSDTNMDVVVVTVDSLDGKSAMAYADDYFDYNGYGKGSERDGCLLLVSMADREWYISTRGYAIKVLNDSDIQSIASYLELSKGDYQTSFLRFAQEVKYEYEKQLALEEDAGKFHFARKFSIAAIIGAIFGFLQKGSLKNQLKSVHKKSGAADYTRAGSFKLDEQRDTFLYSQVTKTEIPRQSSGSSTHTSSSGATHGGGGGKF